MDHVVFSLFLFFICLICWQIKIKIKNKTREKFQCMTFLRKNNIFTINISTTYRFCELKDGLSFSERVKC